MEAVPEVAVGKRGPGVKHGVTADLEKDAGILDGKNIKHHAVYNPIASLVVCTWHIVCPALRSATGGSWSVCQWAALCLGGRKYCCICSVRSVHELYMLFPAGHAVVGFVNILETCAEVQCAGPAAQHQGFVPPLFFAQHTIVPGNMFLLRC
jgi:hypothetical protein